MNEAEIFFNGVSMDGVYSIYKKLLAKLFVILFCGYPG